MRRTRPPVHDGAKSASVAISLLALMRAPVVKTTAALDGVMFAIDDLRTYGVAGGRS
jgi:hypothetical protein